MATALLKQEVDALVEKLGGKTGVLENVQLLNTLAEEKGNLAQPFLVASFAKVMEVSGDKSKNIRDQAIATSKTILKQLSPFALGALMPTLLAGLSVKAKPPQKEATLQIIQEFAELNPKAIEFKLVQLVQPVAELTCDIKKEVKTAATDCMRGSATCRQWS